MIVKSKKIKTHDCWGRTEYEEVYLVEDEDGNVIYQSNTDPTGLIEKLSNINCFKKKEMLN